MKPKRIIFLSILIFLFNVASLKADINYNDRNNIEYETDKLYIKFNPDSQITKLWLENGRNCSIKEFEEILGSHNVSFYIRSGILSTLKKKIDKSNIDSHKKLYSSLNDLELLGIIKLDNPKVPLSKIISRLSELSCVDYVEQVPINSMLYETELEDELVSEQYHLESIQAEEAWKLLKPSEKPIIVAVVDTGIDTTHEDLKGNFWLNEGERGLDENGLSKETNGIDDDENGFIDDVYGWDFFYDDNTVLNGISHGTHVAGIIGATHNKLGVAGVAKNVKLMNVKIGAEGNSTAAINGGEAILYAVMMGADVINCSWGSFKAAYSEIAAFNLASNFAVITVAAGNSGRNINYYPGYFENVLSVSAINKTDKKTSFSNYGVTTDLCAPGDKIMSTTPGNNYQKMSGTSMSSPIVAAAAAMVKNNFPEYTPEQVMARLKTTAVNIDKKNKDYKELLGTGALNIYNALAETNCRYLKLNNIRINDTLTNSFSNIYLELNQTVNITADISNILDEVFDVKVQVVSKKIKFEKDNFFIDHINANSTLTNYFNINGNVWDGNTLEIDNPEYIYVYFYDNNDKEIGRTIITVTINPSWHTINYNNISCSYSMNGGLAYNGYPAIENQGYGFSYKNYSNLLFHGGLLIATGKNNVMNNIFINTDYRDSSFITVDNHVQIIENWDKNFHLDIIKYYGYKTDDYVYETPIIEVTQSLFESRLPGLENTLFIIYDVKNLQDEPIDTLFLSNLFDWDISVVDKNNYFVNQDKIAVIYSNYSDTVSPKINMKVLYPQDNISFASIFAADPEQINKSPYDKGFSEKDKWSNMKDSILTSTMGPFERPFDIAVMMGSSNVYNIPKNSSQRFVLAITVNTIQHLALDEIHSAEDFYNMTDFYNLSINEMQKNIKYSLNGNELFYEIEGVSSGKYKLSIFDLNANQLFKFDDLYLMDNITNKGTINVSNLSSGVYFIVLENNNISYKTKFIIER